MLAKRLATFRLMKEMPSSVFKYGLSIVNSFEVDLGSLSPFSSGVQFEVDSTGKVIVEDFKSAFANHPELLEASFMSSFDAENRLVALGCAFFNNGLFIYLPKNLAAAVNLKRTGKGSSLSYVLVVAGENSELTIVDDVSGDFSFSSGIAEVIAKPGSRVKFASVQKLGSVKNFSFKKASVMESASVEWLEIATGGSITKSEVISDLVGDGARGSIFSIFFGEKEQQFDLFNKCVHIGRNTDSLMLSRGALKGSSRAIQQGFAKIQKGACNSSAHQKSRILLLSESAKATPIPKLEIDNNDVRATHEAAVGQIDSEKLFYITSRGIPQKEARKTFVEGFFEPFISQIAVPKLREGIQRAVAERMEND